MDQRIGVHHFECAGWVERRLNRILIKDLCGGKRQEGSQSLRGSEQRVFCPCIKGGKKGEDPGISWANVSSNFCL